MGWVGVSWALPMMITIRRLCDSLWPFYHNSIFPLVFHWRSVVSTACLQIVALIQFSIFPSSWINFFLFLFWHHQTIHYKQTTITNNNDNKKNFNLPTPIRSLLWGARIIIIIIIINSFHLIHSCHYVNNVRTKRKMPCFACCRTRSS